MNQLLRRHEEVKTCIANARRTEGFRALKTSRKEETWSHIYDIDMLKITGLPVRDLEHLCTGFVDLCLRHLLLFGQHTQLHTWAYYTPAELCREGIRRSPPECIRTLHRGHPSAFVGGEGRMAVSMETYDPMDAAVDRAPCFKVGRECAARAG